MPTLPVFLKQNADGGNAALSPGTKKAGVASAKVMVEKNHRTRAIAVRVNLPVREKENSS